MLEIKRCQPTQKLDLTLPKNQCVCEFVTLNIFTQFQSPLKLEQSLLIMSDVSLNYPCVVFTQCKWSAPQQIILKTRYPQKLQLSNNQASCCQTVRLFLRSNHCMTADICMKPRQNNTEHKSFQSAHKHKGALCSRYCL